MSQCLHHVRAAQESKDLVTLPSLQFKSNCSFKTLYWALSVPTISYPKQERYLPLLRDLSPSCPKAHRKEQPPE